MEQPINSAVSYSWAPPQKAVRNKLIEYIPIYVSLNDLEPNSARIYLNQFTELIRKFLVTDFDRTDIYIDEIDHTFLFKFKVFMSSIKKVRGNMPYQKSSIEIYLKMLSAILRVCYRSGYIANDPITKFNVVTGERKIKTKKKRAIQIITSTSDNNDSSEDFIFWKIKPSELIKIEARTVNFIGTYRKDRNNTETELKRTRLLFLLQTWTGLSWADLNNLKDIRNLIRKDLSGVQSLIYYRVKNGELGIVPIFPQTKQILEELGYDATPRCLYDTYKRRIKMLLDTYGIKCEKAGTHTGRHLFGSRMISAGFTMEAVSRMMAHSSIEETQHTYAKIDYAVISNNYNRITKLDNIIAF